ncbi:MAG: hypothetical protein A2Y73_01010 [Chloroflexi bacterium RBG_13_56_8]|nr:MAG: hypothetical protein A2Y73_01010 [Chloroflexi bacterium RBG_13_56_8]
MSKTSPLRHALTFMHGNILVLTLTQTLGMFGRSMAFPYASLYILALGGEPAQIGLVNSLAPMAGLLAFPIAGYLTDHTGRVKLIGLAGFFSGAVILLQVLAPSWKWLAAAALLQGFMTIQFPPSSAIIADSLAPQDRGRGVATMNMISGVPAMIAPYAAGALLNLLGVNVGMRYLYGFLMIASLVGGAIHLGFLKETSHTAEKLHLSDLPQALKAAYSGIPQMLRHMPRSLRAFTGVIILEFMVNAIAGPFWVVYAVEQIGLSSKEWGLILLLETALRNLMYIPAGAIVDRHGRAKSMLGALLLSLASTPLFVLCTSFTMALVVRLAAGAATAFFIPACSALMADTVPRDVRGRVMANIGQGTIMICAASGGTGGPGTGFLVTIPLMIASFSAGYLYAASPAYPWVFAFIATLASVILSVLFIRDPQKAHI